jgi:hypothetical protein
MKLDTKMLKELIKEAAGPSMLLEEPVIAESSFNRIKGKIDKTNVRFVVMSADRHNFSRNENDQRYTELQAAFKANGFPFTKLQGAWTEKDDEGNEVRVVEKSLIATEEDRGDVERGEDSLFELAKSLTEKYEQDAFIYGWIDETGERQIQARNQAGKYAGYGSWQSIVPVAEDSEFWSRVRGSTFVFKEAYGKPEDHEYPKEVNPPTDDETEDVKFKNEEIEVDAPNSVIEAMIKAEMHKGKKIKFVRRNK